MAMSVTSVETLNFDTIKMSTFVKIVTMAMKSRMDCADKDGSIYSEEALRNLEKNDVMRRPILALGKPGIGKTEIMRGTISRKLNVGIKEVRLGSMQDSDITGLPTFEEVELRDANGQLMRNEDGSIKKKKFTTFANLKGLPHTRTMGGNDPDFGILVLDEITTCNEQVRTVALQLLDSSRSIGESYQLPPGWMIVALGNGPDDGADYAGMPETVISRMTGYYVEPDIESWYEWASQNGIHDVVLGYLRQPGGSDMLFNADYTKTSEYGSQITNPRTWEATSDALRVAEKYSKNKVIDEDLITPICSSGVGSLVGAKLATFYSHRKDVIPMSEILDGTAIKKYKPSQIKTEGLYLSQQAIIREYLKIGTDYADQLKSNGTVRMTFSMRNSKLTDKSADSNDGLPAEAVNKLVNLTDFLMFCAEQPSITAGLDFAISTIESITKSSSYTNNPIPRYMAQPNTQFGKKCEKFNQFISQHQSLLNILHSSGNEAYV